MVQNSRYTRYRAIIRCDKNGNVQEIIAYEITYYNNLCTHVLLETSDIYDVSQDTSDIGKSMDRNSFLGTFSYVLTLKDSRIMTDRYDVLPEELSIECIPELQEGKRYSLTDVQCTRSNYFITVVLSANIGQTINSRILFDTESNDQEFVVCYFMDPPFQLLKVSDSTSESGGNDLVLIISIVAGVIIVVAVIAIGVVFFVKDNKKPNKLPIKKGTNNPDPNKPNNSTMNQSAQPLQTQTVPNQPYYLGQNQTAPNQPYYAASYQMAPPQSSQSATPQTTPAQTTQSSSP